MTRDEAMKIYQDRSSKFANTQSVQWKVNLSLWTLLAFAVYYNIKLAETDQTIRDFNYFLEYYQRAFYFVCALLFVCHFVFCITVQRSLDSDKAVKDDIIRQLNSGKDVIVVDPDLRPTKFRPFKWMAIQVSITVALILMLWIK